MTKVLIVDDEKIIRDGLARLIMDHCPEMTVVGAASNGQIALAELERLRPDICLVDMKMPVMDGAEFIRQARPRYPKVRFVVISGYAEFEYARQLIGYGCDAYLLKPVKIEELTQLLKRLSSQLSEGQTSPPVEPPSPKPEELPEQRPERYIVRQAIQYIQKNYHQDLGLTDVAAAAGMNPSYFSQLFKKETGSTFLCYLTNYRIACAKTLLTSSTFRIHEISVMVGFADPKYFSKVFRKATGVTPVEWREKQHKIEGGTCE